MSVVLAGADSHFNVLSKTSIPLPKELTFLSTRNPLADFFVQFLDVSTMN